MRNSRKIIFAENFKMVMAFYLTQLFLLEENVAKGTFGSIHSSAEADRPLPARPSAAGPRSQGLQLQAQGRCGEGFARGWLGQSPRTSLRPVGKAPAGCSLKSSNTPKTRGKQFSRGCLEQVVTGLKLGRLKS